MPSKSKKQHNLMAAVANNPSFAKKVGISKSVGEDFMKADKGKKFKGGGMMDKKDMAQDKKMAKKAVGMHEKQLHGGKKSDLSALKKGGMCKGYKEGGVAKTVTKEMEYDYKSGKKSFKGSTAKKDAHAEKEGKIVAKHAAYDKEMGMKKGGMAKGCGYAKGGGIEVRGKTKGRII